MNSNETIKANFAIPPLGAYCAAHLAVDMACFYILFACVKPALSPESASAAFLLYNCAAFGLQPLVGLLADSRPHLPLGALGALLVIAALALKAPLAALCVCALGNALFHVAGGRDSLLRSHGRMARPGLFVSTGALGVALGTYLGSSGKSALIPACAAAFCLALLCAVELPQLRASRVFPFTDSTNNARYAVASALPLAAIVALPLAAITVRSYVGFIIPTGWKTTAALAFLPAAASFAGKASGGFLADLLGARRTAVGALVLSIPALCFCGDSALLCAVGIFLFNIAMPVSLCTLASALPSRASLAFGMTTLALLAGSVPAFFFAVNGALAAALIAALTAVAALCTYLSTNNRRFKND